MKNKILNIIPIIIILLEILSIKLYAVTYTSSDCTVESGENITITVKASENIQNYDLSLTSYNGLTFTGCSANENAAVNSSTGAISFATLGNGVTTLGTYTFKAPEVTKDTTYNVVFNINGTSNTAKVTVKAKETSNNSTANEETESSTSGNTSSNNSDGSTSSGSNNTSTATTTSKLTGATVDGNSYKDGAKITVENSTTSVKVLGVGESFYYITVNGNSSSNNVSLEEGTNTVVITDKNGGKVTLYISRLAKEEETQPNVIENNEEEQEENNELVLTTLEVEGLELNPKFNSDTYAYTININMEEKDYSSIKVNAIANQEDATIKIDGTDELVEGENIVNIIVTSKDESEIKTYQIIVNKIVSSSEVVTTSTVVKSEDEIKSDNNKKIIIVSGTIVVLAVIVLIIILVKNKKKSGEDDDEFELYNYDLYEDKEVSENNESEIGNEENNDENIDEEIKIKKKKKGKGKHA